MKKITPKVRHIIKEWCKDVKSGIKMYPQYKPSQKDKLLFSMKGCSVLNEAQAEHLCERALSIISELKYSTITGHQDMCNEAAEVIRFFYPNMKYIASVDGMVDITKYKC